MTSTPAGWFPEWEGSDTLRWWDGQAWTEHVVVRAREPLPPHPTFPVWAAVGGLLALAVPLVLSRPILSAIVEWNLPIAAYIAITGAIAYGPTVWWWSIVSRRYGTGRWSADVGLRVLRADAGWGPLSWVSCLGAQAAVGALVLAFDIPLQGNTDAIRESTKTAAFVIPMVVLAVVLAPFVEEVLFRGIVLRGLLSRMGAAPAIALQAVLFGVAHVDPERGAGNIGLVLVLSAVGAVLGVYTYWKRRLGPAIIGHAILNAVAMTIALSGWTPESQ